MTPPPTTPLQRLLARLPRPLDPLRSFKTKVALLVGLSFACTVTAIRVASDWPYRWAVVAALAVTVVVVQLIAHG